MNNPNNNNPGMQKRMLMMTIIVFAMFLAYEFLVLRPQEEKRLKEQEALQKNQQTTQVQTPGIAADANNSAPSTATVSGMDVPSNKGIAPKSIVTTIKTAKSIIEIDTLGRVAQVTLLEKQYVDEDGKQIQLFDVAQLRPLEVRFSNRNVNDEAFKIGVVASAANVDATSSAQKLVLTQTLSETTVTKTVTFYPDGHFDVDITPKALTQMAQRGLELSRFDVSTVYASDLSRCRQGGEIIAEGSPETIAESSKSYTGHYLKGILNCNGR